MSFTGKIDGCEMIADDIAEMLYKLGRKEDAADAYKGLLKQNPDNLEYYRGFLLTQDLDIGT